MSYDVALQMFTLREEAKVDFVGTLEQVAKIGYRGIEFAGYGGLKASDLKNHLDSLGLKASGSNFAHQVLLDNLDEYIDYNLEIGSSYITLAYTKLTTKDEYLKLVQQCNMIGSKCKKRGLGFCYHNHAHEFNIYDGEYALDIIFERTNPEFLEAVIDVYWVQYAGLDPIKYLKKWGNRTRVVHLKDMGADENRSYAELGKGILDMNGIVQASIDIGAKWLVVEQDVCKSSPIECVTTSYNYLKNLGIV